LTSNPGTEFEVQVHLTGSHSVQDMQDRRIERVTIEWTTNAASVVVTGNGWSETLAVTSASIHEAKPLLYGSLPLAGFDRRARRFWGRVFVLMRLPGGRSLLKWIARRRRH